MKTFKSLLRSFTMTAAVTVLCACTNGSGAATETLQYKPDGKPGSAVGLSYAPVSIKSLGGQQNLSFTLSPEAAFDQVEVSIKADEGMSWLAPSSSVWRSVGVHQPLTVSGLIQGSADGQRYLNVLILTDRAGVKEIRTYALPVSIGSGAVLSKSAGTVEKNAEGETLSVMPGQESH